MCPRTHWILGGAAVYRCDKEIVFIAGFSRRGRLQPKKHLFRKLLSD